MMRRDQFIKKLAALNSGKYLTDKVIELELYVDAQLELESNILKMINGNSQGTVLAGIETLTAYEPTIGVHSDINVRLGSEGTAGSGRKIWSDDLQYSSGNTATSTPWSNLVLEDSTFNGVLSVPLPEGTNKNVAYLLAQKYNSTALNGASPLGGFWGSNNVYVTHDSTQSKLYLNFKLF